LFLTLKKVIFVPIYNNDDSDDGSFRVTSLIWDIFKMYSTSLCQEQKLLVSTSVILNLKHKLRKAKFAFVSYFRKVKVKLYRPGQSLRVPGG